MEATQRRLREVTELLAQTNNGSARYYPLKEEERFIINMLATEGRIAACERDLAAEKSTREAAYGKLVRLGIDDRADHSELGEIVTTGLAIEASITKTVGLTVNLTLQKNEKENLLAKRSLERTFDSTSNRSACVL
jgi:hypothetical protein